MSFEITLSRPSRYALRILSVLFLFIFVLTVIASIGAVAKLGIIFMTVALSLLCLRKQPLVQRLTFDGKYWYIDTPNHVFTGARMVNARSFYWCYVYDFVDMDADKHCQVIWRNQVTDEIWRRLSVMNTLFTVA